MPGQTVLEMGKPPSAATGFWPPHGLAEPSFNGTAGRVCPPSFPFSFTQGQMYMLVSWRSEPHAAFSSVLSHTGIFPAKILSHLIPMRYLIFGRCALSGFLFLQPLNILLGAFPTYHHSCACVLLLGPPPPVSPSDCAVGAAPFLSPAQRPAP